MPHTTNFKTYFVICLVGFSISFLNYLFVRNWEESQIIKELSYRSEARLSAIKNSLRSIIDANQAVRSFIINELITEKNDSLSLHEFQKTAHNLLPQHMAPSMKLVAWLPNLNPIKFQQLSIQSQHETGQKLLLTDMDGKPVSQTTSTVHPLYYVYFNGEPYLPLGVDIASKASHLEHMEASSISNQIELDIGRDDATHQDVSLFLPVFKTGPEQDELLGYVFSQWDIGALLSSAIASFPTSGLDFYLVDETGMSIYTHISRTSMMAKPENPDHILWESSFQIAEHTCQLSSSPTAFFHQQHPIVLAWVTLLFGIILTIIAVFYVAMTKAQKTLIEQQVRLRTQELKQSQQRLEETQKISHLGGWEWDIQSDTLQWSDEVFRIFGHKPQAFQVTFERFNQAIHPDDASVVKEAVNQALKGLGEYDVKHRIILPDQSIRYVNERANVEFDKKGQPVRMVGTVQDISKQYRTERNAQRLSMALAETAESVVITNREGVVRYVNQAFENISGYASSEVVGQNPRVVKSDEHSEEYYQLMWEKITNGQTWAGTFTNKQKNGSHYKVQQTISPIHDEQRQVIGYVAVQRDITLEEQQRSQMEHTQRLESLGILAGGIAHDFNNLLTAIMGNASLAKMKAQTNKPLDSHLTNITTASERAADLCRQMLAYSGQGAYQMRGVDLNRLVSEMNELLQVSLKANTSVTLEMQAAPSWVHGDISQLQQVIMNLVINASEAIAETGESGNIYVRTSTQSMDSKDFAGHFKDGELPSADYICLSVQDEGPGMDDETKMKIFDPFFTTKFSGRGLGMSAVLGIIQAHKGAMNLDTKLGVGTHFKIYFPCAEANPDQKDEGDTPLVTHDDNQAQIQSTVLLVDDESYVLETSQAMLESAGYHVITATTAFEAITRFKQHHQEVDIILLDMTMPEMDGISCARKLREIDDQATILLSSGYSEENISEHTGGLHIDAFLQKPYSANVLIEKVGDLINSTRK